MEAEVEQLAGRRSAPDPNRAAYRWGTEDGFCLIDGQRVPIHKQFSDAYGLEKSTTCEQFVKASRQKLKQLMERSFEGLSIVCLLIDGTIFKGEHMIVAVGLDPAGRKMVLGLRQGASENAEVVGALLGELAERGLDFTAPRLYIVDGRSALRRAVSNYAGDAAFIQRCQVHKIRNVMGHIPEAERPTVKYRMRVAYAAQEAADGRRLILKLHDELLQSNPSAAASLVEGLEECFTVTELRVTPKLRQTLASTNVIESGFSVVDQICDQVKRWQGSDHRLRWIASSLSFAEARWNRIHGYRHMPSLIAALKTAHAIRRGENQAALKAEITAA